MYNNSNYYPGRNLFTRITWYFVNSIFLNSYLFPSSLLKITLLKIFGSSIGYGVIIKPKVNIKYPWLLSIGNNVWIGENVWIDNLDSVIIEDDVCISQGALLLSGNHNYKKNTFDLITGIIHLKKGVWIGANAVVCNNTTAENYSILTVNSVINSKMEKNMIYKGNPAKPIRKRF